MSQSSPTVGDHSRQMKTHICTVGDIGVRRRGISLITNPLNCWAPVPLSQINSASLENLGQTSGEYPISAKSGMVGKNYTPFYLRPNNLPPELLERLSMTFTANGKRKTEKMKLLPALFSSVFSRAKLFVFAIYSRRRYSIFVCFIYGLEEKNSKSELIFAVCR